MKECPNNKKSHSKRTIRKKIIKKLKRIYWRYLARFFYRRMPFIEQIQPIMGRRVKKIIYEQWKKQRMVVIIFNDIWGTALYFTEKGKFTASGPTTRYKG